MVVLCIFIRSGVTRCILLKVLYLDRMCQCWLHSLLWWHIRTLMHRLAAEPCSTAGLLFSSRCLSGTILLTPYSMVWDLRVSKAGPMLLYLPKLLYPYYSLLLFFPYSSFCYTLVFWGWGLRTDRVYITLSHSCTADLFLIKIIIMNFSIPKKILQNQKNYRNKIKHPSLFA